MKNWEKKKLGEVCIVERGSSPRPIEKYQTDSPDGVNWIKIGDTKGVVKYIFSTKEKITKEGAEKSRYVKEDDFILSNSMSFGKPYIMKTDGYIHDGWFVFRLPDYIDKDYFYHLLTSPNVQEQIQSLGAGAIVKNISGDLVKRVDLTYPKSLPEQQRIVAILDDAFAAIAKAKANAEQNLKNAKELFESYLQGVFENKGEGWEEKKLGEIADVIGGYSFKSTDFKKEGKYQVLRMGNIRPGIIRESESPVFIEKLDESILKRALLLKNDVIITQTGTKNKRDYGFTVIIEEENYLLNQRISAIRFPKSYLPKFFLYFSWTNLFKDQYFANETGTVGQGNVGIGAITNAVVPFISLKEQQTIVQKLDALSTETKKLDAIYQQKINDLEELKKSVLHMAFSGELKTGKHVHSI